MGAGVGWGGGWGVNLFCPVGGTCLTKSTRFVEVSFPQYPKLKERRKKKKKRITTVFPLSPLMKLYETF